MVGKMVGKTHYSYKIINKQGMLKMLCNAASLTRCLNWDYRDYQD